MFYLLLFICIGLVPVFYVENYYSMLSIFSCWVGAGAGFFGALIFRSCLYIVWLRTICSWIYTLFRRFSYLLIAWFLVYNRNVLAGLDSDSGRIIWRHKFEEEDAVGRILDVATVGKYVASASGSANIFLRLWEPTKGALVQVSKQMII